VVSPILAPRCFGSAAIVMSASDDALNSLEALIRDARLIVKIVSTCNEGSHPQTPRHPVERSAASAAQLRERVQTCSPATAGTVFADEPAEKAVNENYAACGTYGRAVEARTCRAKRALV
jgi:hypothetical protein